jgi:CBS domain-containing protein
VPVVDDRGRFLGFVFSRQLAPRAAARGPGILGTIAAQDLTSGTILAVHEGTAVSTALRLMAHHGCRVLALVDDEGVLRGALSDVEALGALRRA